MVEEVTDQPLSAEIYRQSRTIEPFISDYLPDEEAMSYADRVAYYRLLKEELGIASVRTEFRMKRLIDEDRSFNQKTVTAYIDSLRAMKEAGLHAPILVLFTPSNWMVEEAKKAPDSYEVLYRAYGEKVKSLCQEAGTAPRYVQVMSEVNFALQTPFDLDQVTKMIAITREVLSPEQSGVKILTSILVGKIPLVKDWRADIQRLLEKAGKNLDAIGIDYYPGSYEKPAGVPLVGKPPFEAFGQKTPYEWLAEQKLNGMLKNKDVLLTEIGVPGLAQESKFQRYGYDRIVQTLDHFFLSYERRGVKAHDIFSSIGFFTAGDLPGVDTRVPMRLDFKPWTLVRRTSEGQWSLTSAGSHLKQLIRSRINPGLK